jgi:hypothetical protein
MNAFNRKKVQLAMLVLFTLSCTATKKTTATENDGRSFQSAIVVDGISEEYAYVRSVCQDCEFVGQSLVFEKKKPYDVLKFNTPEGETKLFYFDISKFFGKY